MQVPEKKIRISNFATKQEADLKTERSLQGQDTRPTAGCRLSRRAAVVVAAGRRPSAR